MTLDTSALRVAALAATQPSPWTVREDVASSMWGVDYNHVVIDRDSMWVAECGEDAEQAAFIALANPATVLALLDRVSELERLLGEALRGWHGEVTVSGSGQYARINQMFEEMKR